MAQSTVQSNTCQACKRSPMGRCLSHTTLPFGQYGPQTFKCLDRKWGFYPAAKGEPVNRIAKTFDEVPLGYLDWLSGQSYVNYGWLRDRLTAYLTRPVIAKELDELFPDPDDDSRQPLFYCHPDSQALASVTCTMAKTQQRREPMPKEFIPTLDQEDIPMSYTRAWQTVATALDALEDIDSQEAFDEFHRIRNQHDVRRAVQKLGYSFHFTAIKRLREAYRTCQERIKALTQPSDEKSDAQPRQPRRRARKHLKVRRRRLNHALAIVSIEANQ